MKKKHENKLLTLEAINLWIVYYVIVCAGLGCMSFFCVSNKCFVEVITSSYICIPMRERTDLDDPSYSNRPISDELIQGIKSENNIGL